MNSKQFSILIVEDNDKSAMDIRRTIRSWCERNNSMGFNVTFCEDFSLDGCETIDDVLSSVLDWIMDGRANAVIIDYKLETSTHIFNGADLFTALFDMASRFPVVILTNKGDDCEMEPDTDGDKIYKKTDFLRADTSISDSLIFKFLSNIKKSIEAKEKIIEEIEKILSNKTEIDYKKYLSCQQKYSLYEPGNHSATLIRELGIEPFTTFTEMVAKATDYIGGER